MSARGWALFAAVSVIWGVPYLFIKIAVDGGVSPGFVAWSRVVLGALVLLPIAWKMGALRGLRAKALPLVLFATFEISIPFPLISFGEQYVSSSLAAIIVATLPLTLAVVALRFDRAERVTGTRLVGMFVGLAGVVALLGLDVSGDSKELLGAGAVLLATFGYAVGPMIVKRHFSEGNPIGPVAVALGIASVLLLPFGLLGAPTETPAADALASIAVLGVVCSALAFVLVFPLIAEAGPTRMAVITYINPVVAVALGVAVLDEALTAGAIAALLLILAGSWLSTDGRLPPSLMRLLALPSRPRSPARQSPPAASGRPRRSPGVA
jgi:drug/metabolite transporter (DMT)-like permease